MKVLTLQVASWAVVSDNVGADIVGAHWGAWVWGVSVLYSQAAMAKPEAVAQHEQEQDL